MKTLFRLVPIVLAVSLAGVLYAQQPVTESNSTSIKNSLATIEAALAIDATHAAAVKTTGPQVMLGTLDTLSTVTLVTTGQAARATGGTDGVQIVRTNTLLGDIVRGNASNTDGASFQVIAAAGAGIKQYLRAVTCSNTSTTGIYVEVKSGTTVVWTIPVPAAAASDVNGYTFAFPDPLPPNAANEAWNLDGSAAVTTLICSAQGFKSKI